MSADTRTVVAVCAAEILGLAGFSLVPALLPQFLAAWSLTNGQGGWLAGMVSAGYMLAVIPLVGLTDRIPARSIYLASSAVGALSCFGIAISGSLPPALFWRGITGVALAGMYMPGLRALTEGMAGARRARVAAWYTSSFTLGTSLSFLLGRAGTLGDWQSAFLIAGLLGAGGTLIAWMALPHPAPVQRTPHAWPNPRQPAVNRDALVLTIGYAATIWGTAGLRQWIVVFLSFCAAAEGHTLMVQGWSTLAIAALIGLLGVPAGLLGNELSLRLGLRATATGVLLSSALVNPLIALAAGLPYQVTIVLALLAGFIAQGNFSNLTSGILAAADPRHLGATIALYPCIGFGAAFVGTVLFGVALDRAGGASQVTGWVVAFSTCGAACLAGAIATIFLSPLMSRRASHW